jgi:hypothetical protein
MDEEQKSKWMQNMAIFVGVALVLIYLWRQYKSYKEEIAAIKWPRVVSNCPDYFVSESGDKCRNVFNLGKCPANNGILQPNGVLDFSGAEFKGMDGDKKKCERAKACDITWEGIDNLCA